MRCMATTILAAAGLLGFHTVAYAQPAAPAVDPAPATAKPAEDELVCVTQDAGFNSRLGSAIKVCHTQKEWDALPKSRRERHK